MIFRTIPSSLARRLPGPVLMPGLLLALLAAPVAAVPEIERWETAGGARVLYTQAPELPILDLRLLFDAGSARDGERSGLATLTASLLTQGAGDWDADTLAARLDDVGARLSASADRDTATVSLRTLTRPPALETALETLTALIAQPRFGEADVARERTNQLIALRQEEQSPRAVGQRRFFREVFGAHPYAAHPAGQAESVAALTRADLVEFHRAFYTQANLTIAIVGDLDRAAAESLAERLVAGLPTGERAPPLPEVLALTDQRIEHLSFPASQTTVLAGQPGMARGDSDYFALYVGNHILGGSGLVSRLMDEIREQRGLSYSTYSYFQPLARPGPFLMGLQTRNDQTGDALALLLETLERFIREGPGEEELRDAQRNITGGFPLRIASNRDKVQYLAMIGFHDLPLDYLARFTERVEAVTVEQIRDAFQRRIDPRRLVIVTVGGDRGA